VQSHFYDPHFELNFFNIPSKMILRIGLTILKKLKLNIFMTVNTFNRDLYKNGQKLSFFIGANLSGFDFDYF
jgi:hypothetical protein